jgi:hypothetical protein
MNKFLLTAIPLALVFTSYAQQSPVTLKDYQRAEQMLTYNTLNPTG